MIISSTSNQHIKEIRKLKDRKYRQDSGVFFIEGIRIVIEALQESNNVVEIICCKDLIRNESAQKAIKIAEQKKIQVLEVSTEVFESLSNKDGPQGLAAIIKQSWGSLESIDFQSNGIWVGLYEVADPGNLGTIIRTIDGSGARGVILINNCTDPFDPSSIRASMGTIFSKSIIKATDTEFIKWVKSNNIKVFGTSDASKMDYSHIKYPDRMVLLMGSEREGLPEKLSELCDKIVSIPMLGKADSLNLSVATSIILYEIHRQHQQHE